MRVKRVKAKWWWVVLNHFCCGVEVRQGVITDIAPVFKKFMGQPIGNLTRWVKSKGGKYRECEPLTTEVLTRLKRANPRPD